MRIAAQAHWISTLYQPGVAFAQARGATFACTLIVARTTSGPRQEMPGGRKAAHVATGRRNDRPCGENADAGNCGQEGDHHRDGGLTGLDLCIHAKDRSSAGGHPAYTNVSCSEGRQSRWRTQTSSGIEAPSGDIALQGTHLLVRRRSTATPLPETAGAPWPPAIVVAFEDEVSLCLVRNLDTSVP